MLIIFDLDGTLLNTIDDLANACNHALQEFNFPTHESEAYRFFVGDGVNTLMMRILPEEHRNADSASMLKHEFLKYYSKHAEDCTKPYEGIPELLSNLQKQGHQLAVASNKMHTATVEIVHKYFPNIHFVAVLGQREGIPVKPAPNIINEIIEMAGVAKSDAVFVGDTNVDVNTALNAELKFIGVLWGFRPRAELEVNGAKIFVEKPEEILKLIK